MVEISVKCIQCGTVHTIQVPKDDFEKYQRGEGFIQDIFPYMEPEIREMLISRICGKCFDEMFKEDE